MVSPYIEAWARGLLTRPTIQVPDTADIEGVCNVHTGPSWRFARISVEVEPSADFAVSFDLEDSVVEYLQQYKWLDAAVFGVLDVLATARSAPVFGVKIHIKRVEYSPVDSSETAFRLAGRDAAQKIVERLSTDEPNAKSRSFVEIGVFGGRM